MMELLDNIDLLVDGNYYQVRKTHNDEHMSKYKIK